MTNPLRILLADDHTLFQVAVKRLETLFPPEHIVPPDPNLTHVSRRHVDTVVPHLPDCDSREGIPHAFRLALGRIDEIGRIHSGLGHPVALQDPESRDALEPVKEVVGEMRPFRSPGVFLSILLERKRPTNPGELPSADSSGFLT